MKTQAHDPMYSEPNGLDGSHSGLNKLELFSAFALAGLMNRQSLDLEDRAKLAVQQANWLIKELNKQTNE